MARPLQPHQITLVNAAIATHKLNLARAAWRADPSQDNMQRLQAAKRWYQRCAEIQDEIVKGRNGKYV